MYMPKVSIMIPTFNQDKYILRAIQSAQSQSYPNLEIVISDDHSTDNTENIVQDFIKECSDDRVKYFRNTENQGILRNYKTNLEENASGDWVINLDGDDFFIDNDYIVEAMNLIASDTSIKLIFGNYSEWYQSTEKMVDITNRNLQQVMSDEEFFELYANDQIVWNHSSIIYHRNSALALGFYWHETLPRNDWESFLRLIVGNKVGYLNRISAAWVQHDANETRRLDINKYLKNFGRIKGVAQFAKDQGMREDFIEQWYKKMLHKSARGSCIGYIRNRDFNGMIDFLKHVAKIDRFLVIKILFDPSLALRAILSINPNFYLQVKTVGRKLLSR